MSTLPVKAGDLLGAIQKTVQSLAADTDGLQYLKMEKNGAWIYGAEEVEIEDASLWAIHPASFKTGFISWEKGNIQNGPVGEEMCSITDDPIIQSELPPTSGKWAAQVSLQAACINGADEGTQVVYKSSSQGGRSAFGNLLSALLRHYADNPGTESVIPVVALDSESYSHKEYGKIYKPVFDIVEWADNDGTVDEPEQKKIEKPKAKKRVKKTKAKELTKEAPAPRRRRRRAV
jgi:cobalamin biosynthesis Mg chelatase CobN